MKLSCDQTAGQSKDSGPCSSGGCTQRHVPCMRFVPSAASLAFGVNSYAATYTCSMRASITAKTRVTGVVPVAALAARASSATANKVSIGNTDKSAPKAKPCATEHAVRKPVNAPGPRPNTTACKSVNANPASFKSVKVCGIMCVDVSAPPALVCVHVCVPRATARERVSVLVSKASHWLVCIRRLSQP